MATRKIILRGIIVIIISIVAFSSPVNAQRINYIETNQIHISPIFSELKYEVKEKTSLENPVVDPNFNKMRKADMNKPLAIILVAGILILAVTAPLVAWKYFSR